jgi:hypothetical protein
LAQTPIKPAPAHSGIFCARILPEFIRPLEKKMISNSKQNCIAEISSSARRSAVWRRELHAKYNDPRNGKAADTLDRLANEMYNLSDEDWFS